MKPQAIRYPDFAARAQLRAARARGEKVRFPPKPAREHEYSAIAIGCMLALATIARAMTIRSRSTDFPVDVPFTTIAKGPIWARVDPRQAGNYTL